MSLELTPIDVSSGLPYTIMPLEGRVLIHGRDADDNHAFFPRLDPVLRGSLGGMALRYCRVQLVDYATHHNRYHVEFVGTPLPETEEDQYRTVVMAAAGDIPAHALDYSMGRKAQIVPIDEHLRWNLWRTGQIRVESASVVREFLMDYTLRRPHIEESANARKIDEFLNTRNEVRRLQLAHDLLMLASYRATDAIAPIYNRAWRQAQLPPDRTSRVWRFVAQTTVMYRRDYKMVAKRIAHVLEAA